MEKFSYGRGFVIVHVLGVGWDRLPIPARWHRCETATFAFVSRIGFPSWIQRCRCGARKGMLAGDDMPKWIDRNSRRRGGAYYYMALEG